MSDETKGESVYLAFEIPKGHKFTYTVNPMAGRLLSAELLGGQLIELGKLLKASGKQADPTIKWHVAVSEIFTKSDGTIQFGLVMAPLEKGEKTLSAEAAA